MPAKKFKEEPKPGVPAFMATFADLMTLLLVFFILLNVYAQERQTGLLEAMSGSMANALYPVSGKGGLLEGSDYVDRQKRPRAHFAKQEKLRKEAVEERTGDEVELRKSRAENLEATSEVELAGTFRFRHGSPAITREGYDFLDGLARSLEGGRFILEVEAAATFGESMMPMELAASRIQKVLGALRALGVEAEIRPKASVARPGRDEADPLALRVRIVRLR